MKILLVLLIVCMVLAGCSNTPAQVGVTNTPTVNVVNPVNVVLPDVKQPNKELAYFYDYTHDVGIWIYAGSNGYAIAVVPAYMLANAHETDLIVR